ncbi:MAG TPA: hypothetical protein VG733_01880, partial [Chthoniobacteraceae bacterium]|nr:hypothetical protein [Chthoniobacteraceae bacterium]
VVDDPPAKRVMLAQYSKLRRAFSPAPVGGGSARAARRGGVQGHQDPTSRPHKPHHDEMGIATRHEFKPARDGDEREAKGRSPSFSERPRKPNLDEMGPGVESIPGGKRPDGPRSTLGRPGMRGGFKPRGRR